jgi:hypothetical protein
VADGLRAVEALQSTHRMRRTQEFAVNEDKPMAKGERKALRCGRCTRERLSLEEQAANASERDAVEEATRT